MVTGKSGYTASKARKLIAARSAVRKAATALRGRTTPYLRAPLRTGGFYGGYYKRGREELKTIDVDNISGGVPAAGNITLLNGVSQGTDYTDRIGRKIMLKSILWRGFIYPNPAVTLPGGSFCRIMIFYDCQTNATAPSVSDVLQTTSYDSPLNLTNRDRFKVMFDKFYAVNSNAYSAGALTAGSPMPKQIKFYKKMSMEVIFGSTGGTVGSIQTGGLFLLTICALTNNACLLDSYSRTRFTDG